MYVCMYVCVCMCVCIHVYMYVCMYVCMYVYMYICMCVCIHVYMYVCMIYVYVINIINNYLNLRRVCFRAALLVCCIWFWAAITSIDGQYLFLTHTYGTRPHNNNGLIQISTNAFDIPTNKYEIFLSTYSWNTFWECYQVG